MSGIFDDTMQGLLEALEIKNGNISMVEKENMPAPTFVASDVEKELIDKMIEIRKEQNMSQGQLADITGNKQQAISRLEKKENSPSLKFFVNVIHALGYELQLTKIVR